MDEIDYALYVALEFPEELLEKISLESGQWKEIRNYRYRVDPVDPNIPCQRHIHIEPKNGSRKAAWNDDGSRHDNHSFDEKFGSRKVVQQIARDILNLSEKNITLEHYAVEDFFEKYNIEILSIEYDTQSPL